MARNSGKKINELEDPNKYKVGVYIRTGKKVEGLDATVFQRDRIEEYCNDLGLTILEEYVDDGVDMFAKEKPEYQRMIKDIKEGKIDLVVSANLVRIARSKNEVIQVAELAQQLRFRVLLSDSREEIILDKINKDTVDQIMNEQSDIEEEIEEDDEMEF